MSSNFTQPPAPISTLAAVSEAVTRVVSLTQQLLEANIALKTAITIHAATLKQAPDPGPPLPFTPRQQQTP